RARRRGPRGLPRLRSSLSAPIYRSDEELDECVDLRGRQRLSEVRHHTRRIALLDVRVRLRDRLPGECGERLGRLPRVRPQLVEVGTRRAGRLRGGERVTTVATFLVEQRKTGLRARRRSGRAAAGCRRL